MEELSQEDQEHLDRYKAWALTKVPAIPAPTKECLISCTVDTFSGRAPRDYIVRRTEAKNGYSSTLSGGSTIHFTKDAHGPEGEPIVDHREFVLSSSYTDGDCYVCDFRTWDDVLLFLVQMRAQNVEWVSD